MNLLELKRNINSCLGRKYVKDCHCNTCSFKGQDYCVDALLFAIDDYVKNPKVKLGIKCCNCSVDDVWCRECPYDKNELNDVHCIDRLLEDVLLELEED